MRPLPAGERYRPKFAATLKKHLDELVNGKPPKRKKGSKHRPVLLLRRPEPFAVPPPDSDIGRLMAQVREARKKARKKNRKV